jgi:H+-transporting ATPase
MAVYGLYIMTPIGWGWAMFVWGYALVWALATDRVKLLAYRVLDPAPAKDRSSAKKPPDRKLKVAAAT